MHMIVLSILMMAAFCSPGVFSMMHHDGPSLDCTLMIISWFFSSRSKNVSSIPVLAMSLARYCSCCFSGSSVISGLQTYSARGNSCSATLNSVVSTCCSSFCSGALIGSADSMSDRHFDFPSEIGSGSSILIAGVCRSSLTDSVLGVGVGFGGLPESSLKSWTFSSPLCCVVIHIIGIIFA